MTMHFDTPCLGILNEADAPHQNMVVAVTGKPDKYRWAYVVPRERGNAENFHFEPTLFTPLRDFGIVSTMSPDGKLALQQITVSRAVYPNGQTRRWQGAPEIKVDIAANAASAVVQYVRAEWDARCKREPVNAS